MFQFGSRVLTRKGTQGLIVRQLADRPPYYYLVAAVDGTALVAFHDELTAATAEPAIRVFGGRVWNDAERRRTERRLGERRRSANVRAGEVREHRSGLDRRQKERRQNVWN